MSALAEQLASQAARIDRLEARTQALYDALEVLVDIAGVQSPDARRAAPRERHLHLVRSSA